MKIQAIQNLFPLSIREKISSLISPKTSPRQETTVRLACDLGRAKIAFLEVTKSPEGLSLTRFHKMARPKEDKDLIEVLQKTFTELGFQTKKVRISIKGQGVVIRFVQFPKMTEEELRGAIAFEAEKYIPFKTDEVITDFHIIEHLESTNGPMMNVLLVAVKKEEIYPLINIYQSAGLQVELVDVDVLAFMNALEHLYVQEFQSQVGILDLGNEISTLGIISGGKPQFIRDISYGGIDLVKRLKRKLGLTMEQAIEQLEIDRKPEAAIEAEIIEGLSPLVADLKVSLDYYIDQVHLSGNLEKLFISGGAGYHPIVTETLSKDLGFSICSFEIEKIKISESIDAELIRKNRSLLPIAFGLCLREL